MSLAETSARPRRPPRRRRYFLLGIVLLCLLAPVGYYFYADWVLATRLEQVLAETDRLDPNWRIEDIEKVRDTPRPEQNAALHTLQVSALINNRGQPRNADKWSEVFADLRAQHQLTPQQLGMIREALAGNAEALTEARKLKDLPYGRFPMTFSPDFISSRLDGQQRLRGVMDLLNNDVMLQAHSGDLDGAGRSCAALLNTGRALGDEPMLISFLIRCAGDHLVIQSVERILAQGFPKEAVLKDLQERLRQERDDARRHWINANRGERAGGYLIFQAIANRQLQLGQVIGAGSALDKLFDIVPMLFTKDFPDHLEYLNETVAAARLPDHEQLAAFHGLDQKLRSSSSRFTRMLAPAVLRVVHAHLRNQGQLAAAETALACERYRIIHRRWPKRLEELVEVSLIAEVPADPIDGAPLRYRLLPDGAVVYSVGLNRADDGGVFNREFYLAEGNDFGVQLWDPARRRQAPGAK